MPLDAGNRMREVGSCCCDLAENGGSAGVAVEMGLGEEVGDGGQPLHATPTVKLGVDATTT